MESGTLTYLPMRFCKCLLRTCTYAALTFYAWYTIVYVLPTWSREKRGSPRPWWEQWRLRNTIKYHMDAPGNHVLITGGDVQMILLWWLPLVVAAVCTYASALVPTSNVQATLKSRWPFLLSVKRSLQWQIPPRRFWLYWCDGLSLAEFAGVAVWIVIHCVGLWNYIEYYRIGSSQRSEIGFRTAVPRSVLYLEWIAFSFAWMSYVDFAFLFLPLSHNGFLSVLTGLPYSALIRYHRWIGNSALFMISLHASFFTMYFIANPYINVWEHLFDFGQIYRINVVAGVLALTCGLALWVTSLNYVRRLYFEVFYRTHIVGFLGFVTFAFMHYRRLWNVLLPGLVLYAADYVTRVVQGAAVVTPQAAYVSDNDSVAVVELPAAAGFSKCPIQDIFLLFPTISRWQWHPFTIMARSEGENGAPGTVTVAMKNYGNWTKKVMRQLTARSPVPVRIAGAFDGVPVEELQGYNHLLLIGGGIGATPLIALLSEIKQLKKMEDPAMATIRHVQFIWVARSTEELSIIPEHILMMASSEPWMSLQLHYTGKAPISMMGNSGIKLPVDINSQYLPAGKITAGSITGIKLPSELGSQHSSSSRSQTGGPEAQVGGAWRFSNASPYFWNAARPMQPYGHLLSLVTVVVASLGAFLGLALASTGDIEWVEKYSTSDKYWKQSMIMFTSITVQMIGLPMMLVVLPRYYFFDKHVSPVAEEGPSSLPSAKIQADGAVGYPESGVSANIRVGRPDFKAVLEEVVTSGQATEVCVYCAGPQAMTNQVALLIWELNDKREKGQPHLDFKKYAYEL